MIAGVDLLVAYILYLVSNPGRAFFAVFYWIRSCSTRLEMWTDEREKKPTSEFYKVWHNE